MYSNTDTTIKLIETYKQAVRNNFAFLKQIVRLDDLSAKSIPLPNGKGLLVPVCELYATDDELIEKFAQWRAENSSSYPSQFPVTISGTATWLRSKVLDVDDRILFLVLDKHGNTIGHLGFANAINDEREMEIDNVVRGVKDVQPGIMSSAMKALLNWAKEVIGPGAIYLRVFSDNHRAIEFYHKLGFQDNQLLPLRRCEEGNCIYYRPLAENDHAEPDKYFLRMVYTLEEIVDGSETILTADP